MRRAMILSAVLGVLTAGLGCRHVAGLCDCTNDPANAQLNTGGPGIAYPTVGQPITGTAVPEKMPAPAATPAPAAGTPMGK